MSIHSFVSKFGFLLLLAILMVSCSTTKKLQEDQVLLQSNVYKFKDKINSINLGQVSSYVKEQPNSKLLGFYPLKLHFYNLNKKELDPVYKNFESLPENLQNQKALDSLYLLYDLPKYLGRKKWLGRFINRNSEEPKIFDEIKVEKSRQNLQRYLVNQLGYFDAEIKTDFKLDKSKAKVIYQIQAGKRASIDSIEYTFVNKDMGGLYKQYIARTELVKNNFLNLKNFEKERDRINTLYHNNGYYKFNEDGNQIKFFIDSSSLGKFQLITKLNVSADSLTSKKYKYGSIYIYGDSDYLQKRELKESTLFRQFHNGYNLRFTKENKFRPRVYTDLIIPEVGKLYSFDEIQNTKKNIYSNENFTLTDMETTVLSETDSILNLSVWLKPKKKYDLKLFLETAYSDFLGLGVTPGASLLTRNIFQGGENLSFTFQGTIGTVASDAAVVENKFFNAYQLSFQSKLSFPRFFLFLDNEGTIPKSWNPTSDIAVGASLQRNIGLGRISYNASFNYRINPTKTTFHSLNIFNTNFINNLESNRYFDIFSSDKVLFNNTVEALNAFDLSLGANSIFNGSFATSVSNGSISLDNAISLISDYYAQVLGFDSSLPIGGFTLDDYGDFISMANRRQRLTQDYFVNSFIYDFALDQSKNEQKKHPWFLSTKVEVAGLLLRAFDETIGLPEVEIEQLFVEGGQTLLQPTKVKGLFDLPYSEYLKINFDLRKNFYFNKNSALVFRNFVGVIYPYGNSENLSIPFDRAYFAGGSNDIRAWRAFSLGPTPQSVLGDFAVENMKITWNLEYRFKLLGAMNSALFVDAGNIWAIKKDDFVDLEDSGVFTFNNFHKQLAVGGGLGFRYDFNYLILRMDFAYKLRDPTILSPNKWVLNDFNLLQPTLNFGINYPF